MRPLVFALLLALLSCSETSAPPAAPDEPSDATPPADSDASGLAGVWYLYMHELPWMALRVQVLAAPGGPSVSWISFDWSASPDAERLAEASKPVSVSLQGHLPSITLDGPAPMVGADGEPNGQQGRWHVELHAPEGSARLTGKAVTEELTKPEGTPAELTREWRVWRRP
jgi:hypothetical protein